MKKKIEKQETVTQTSFAQRFAFYAFEGDTKSLGFRLLLLDFSSANISIILKKFMTLKWNKIIIILKSNKDWGDDLSGCRVCPANAKTVVQIPCTHIKCNSKAQEVKTVS